MNRSSLEPVGTLSARPYALPPSIMVLVVVLALGWGSNWPVMKVVMTEMAPLHFRVLCLIAGAAGLFAIAQANRLSIRVPKGSWPRLVAIAAFNVAAWNVLAVYGVTFMESGRAAILAYTFPVWSVLLGVWFLREPLTGRRLAGVILGLLGMLLLLGQERQAVGRSPSPPGLCGDWSTMRSSARSSATGRGSKLRPTRRSASRRSPR